jgi:hypothetical protein
MSPPTTASLFDDEEPDTGFSLDGVLSVFEVPSAMRGRAPRRQGRWS